MADKYDDLDDILDDFDAQGAPDPDVGHLSLEDSQPAAAPHTDSAAAAVGPTATTDKAEPTKPNTSQGASTANPESRSTENKPKPKPEEDEEFADKLRLGMDELMEEMNGDPEAQRMFSQLFGSLNPPNGSKDQTSSSSAPPKPAKFEDTISETVNRLNESQQKASQQRSPQDGDAFLNEMLRELQGAAGSGEDAGGFDGLLAGLMQELTSKDILYEPLKEMHTKYPEWLSENESKISASELQRYRGQQRVVAEIVAKFEEPGYRDDNSQCREYISTKMEEMQASGAPPDSLVGDLADGALPGVMPPGGGGIPNCGTQ